MVVREILSATKAPKSYTMDVTDDIKKYLWLSQISLVGFLVICCFITPSVVIANGGVSNFGNHRSTVVFYVLAFSLNIILLYLVAKKFQKLAGANTRLGGLLLILAFLYLLVLISTFPRHISWAYSEIHDYLGILLFVYEFFLSIWLVIKLGGYKNYLILGLETLGSLIGLLSILKIVHLLFIGQLIGTIGFGLILVVLFPRLIELKAETGHPAITN
jgi:hypothetical protein